MKFHAEELALARAYTATLDFEGLTESQMLRVMTRGRELFHWFKAHRYLHCAISTAVLLFIFGADWFVQVKLPSWLLRAPAPATQLVVAAALVVGATHSWLMYSLSVYSMHEGAAHQVIYPPFGPVSRVLHRVSANLCRIAASEPKQYSIHHMIHHSKFGSDDDAEFLNFVRARRYWPTFLPLAFDVNYTDFIVHRPLAWTRDRLMSGWWAIPYHGLYAWYALTRFGLLFTIVAYVVVLPHLGFVLDRVRQFTEHNLMPLDNKNGSRSFGYGFWGILVGGGPWGSPCHWEHHLVPSLPWYQQLILHRDVVRLLTPRQRRQFLIQPVIGFPKLWWSVVRDATRFEAPAAGARPPARETSHS
jgi:hypothetical protein